MKRNQIILFIALIALAALGIYYYVAIHIPAQEQARIIGGF